MELPLPLAESAMRHALELAKRGEGRVEPNPMVGAVIVDDFGTILGEGWHQEFGGPHAEVHAISSAGEAARGSTMFVTLEPCCHFGKTPPCSRAVIAAGIRRVVVAMRDPAPHVDGGGIKELRNSGIEVEVGLLEKEARRIVAPFVQLTLAQRPWIHAKWAMTLDGKIASRTGHSQWISNESSRVIVHQLRGRMDAIVVGIGTAICDNPLLTARPSGPRTATRIVIDSRARLAIDSQLVQTALQAPVIVITTMEAASDRCEKLRVAGIEIVQVESNANGYPDLNKIVEFFGRRRFTNVLVEGGSQLLGAFNDANLVDEIHAFIAPKFVGGAESPTPFSGRGRDSIPTKASIETPIIEVNDGDIYVHGRIVRNTIQTPLEHSPSQNSSGTK